MMTGGVVAIWKESLSRPETKHQLSANQAAWLIFDGNSGINEPVASEAALAAGFCAIWIDA